MHSCNKSKDGKYCPSVGKAVSTQAYFTVVLGTILSAFTKATKEGETPGKHQRNASSFFTTCQ